MRILSLAIVACVLSLFSVSDVKATGQAFFAPAQFDQCGVQSQAFFAPRAAFVPQRQAFFAQPRAVFVPQRQAFFAQPRFVAPFQRAFFLRPRLAFGFGF
jgi:hypothetical protein